MQVFGLPRQVISSARGAAGRGKSRCGRGEPARRSAAPAPGQGAGAERAGGGGERIPGHALSRWRKRPELRFRRPRWSPALAERVEALQEDSPVWGKRKLGPLLRAEDHALSDKRRRAHPGPPGAPRTPTAPMHAACAAPCPPKPRRSRADRHPLAHPAAGQNQQTLHRCGPLLPLDRRHGRLPGRLRFRRPLSPQARPIRPLPHPRHPGRRRFRVPQRLRKRLPTTPHRPLCPPSPQPPTQQPPTQRARRTYASHLALRVLLRLHPAPPPPTTHPP